MYEDHGSNKALVGAVLQLVGGVLIASALWFGFIGQRVTVFGAGVGLLVGGYFAISGGVRIYLAIMTRRANR